MNETTRKRLMAYHDGELGRVRSAWVRWHVARSPELARELEGYAGLSRIVREAGDVPGIVNDSLWPEISLGLASLSDRAGAGQARADAGRALGAFGLGFWRPAGAGIVVLAAVGLWFALSGNPGSLTPVPETAVRGGLRYLDTHGRPVVVVDEAEDLTIIWLMDADESAGI